MVRRAALVVFLALGALVSAASAQQADNVKGIGFLGPSSAPPPAIPPSEVLRKALANLGYVDGRNIIIHSRWPEGNRLDQLPEAAAALVSLKPDVIVAVGATAVRAAKGATTQIPIVFGVVVDPVAAGFVTTLEQPGGNVTGFTNFDPRQAGQQLEILREALPGLTHVALLGDAGAAPALFQTNEEAARALGLRTQTLKVDRTNPDFDAVFEVAKRDGVGAIVILSTPVTTPNRRRIAELAIKHRLPTLSPRDHADAGGLMSYGTGLSEAVRRTAGYVDRILKGAKPGELPVETVRQHELLINLTTAKALGLSIPPSLMMRAGQVIE